MFIIDDIDFSDVVIIDKLEEAFELAEGEASVITQANEDWYDITGTRYTHTVSILRNDEASPDRWDEFYNLVTKPVDFHKIEIDHNQSSITYFAHIYSGARSLVRVVGGKKIWSDLTLTFRPSKPQREAED